MDARYSVGTWDTDLQCFTPQEGVPAFNLTLSGLRKSLRLLRECGYTAHRFRSVMVMSDGSEMIDHGDNDFMVLVERTDGMTEAEILESWKR
jgi:hypothetical protein